MMKEFLLTPSRLMVVLQKFCENNFLGYKSSSTMYLENNLNLDLDLDPQAIIFKF